MFAIVFEEKFLLLPPKHQQIWKVLWWFCTKHKASFPSHEKIAEYANCSIRTVATALANFKIFGWLQYKRRCYRSNVYYIRKDLLKKDPKDKTVFQNALTKNLDSMRENCRTGCRVYNVASNVATERKDVQHSRADFSGKSEPPKQIVHPLLVDLPFKREDKFKIQRNFNERILGIALASYKSYKYSPRNPIALFLWLCKDAKKYINSLTNKAVK